MNIFLPLFLSLALTTVESPEKTLSQAEIQGETVPMDEIYHPVSTKNIEAQAHFNKGLTYIFAFNHDVAFKEFEKASQLDPNLAMAYWGMALAIGQNINNDITPENQVKAYGLIQKALELSKDAPPNEQDYIKALSVRYVNDPKADFIPLRFKYREAMKKVTEKYPQDIDAATMYAESILDLDPWKYWTQEGRPKEGTPEAIIVLDSVLKRNPEHIGANHYAIHIWEESPVPERALINAQRLTTLLPESGHLMHMPCHIFIQVGDYYEAIRTDKRAIAADKEYIEKNGLGGEYPLHYLSHNLYVLARAYMLAEDYPHSIEAALELRTFVEPHLTKMPHAVTFLLAPLQTYLHFHRWKEILDYQIPDTTHHYVRAYYHFSRATAFAKLGDIESARKEEKLMNEVAQRVPKDELISNNEAKNILEVADNVLKATFAEAEKKGNVQIEHLKKAAELQDQLFYDEPPAWYFPVRSQLGKAYIEQEQYLEAIKAFEKELKKLQRNGRLLFGLTVALKKDNRQWDAYWTEREANDALKYASQALTLKDL